GVAWFAIEELHQVQVTIFQPFRMATVARGIAVIIIAGRLVALCRSGGPMGGLRATLLAVGFVGDWLLVVVTSVELAVSAVEAIRLGLERGLPRAFPVAVLIGVFAAGLNFLGHHDTESGHIPLVVGLGFGLVLGFWIPLTRRSATLFPQVRGNGSCERDGDRPVRIRRRLGVSL